jgi:uncharacterized protein (TIGR02145 family)
MGTAANPWQRGVPTGLQLNAAFSPPNVWGTILNGNPTSGQGGYVMSPLYNFRNSVNTALRFRMNRRLGNSGSAFRISFVDELFSSWQTLGSVSDPTGVNWYNATGTIGGIAGPAWNGNSGFTGELADYVEHRLKLPDSFNNRSSLVRFRLDYQGGFTPGEGVIIDDWAIIPHFSENPLCLPSLITSLPINIGIDSVIIGGNITNDGGSSVVLRGICYSTSPNPNMGNQRTEDGSGIGSFNTVLRGLTSSITYYARSYAKNSNGVVVYGNEVTFTTSASGVRCPGTPTVTDIDGNVYNTVQIGNQCWTQSNLKVSKYRNGDTIPTGLNYFQWSSTTSGAYAIYDNNPINDGLYGKLYNHYTVTDSRGLCPTGWHVPTDAEWTTLENHFGGSSLAGGSLKSTAMQPTLGGWNPPNTGATNSSGFTALPGGVRTSDGDFLFMPYDGCWWSSSVASGSSVWYRILFNYSSDIARGDDYRSSGFSVRCCRD